MVSKRRENISNSLEESLDIVGPPAEGRDGCSRVFFGRPGIFGGLIFQENHQDKLEEVGSGGTNREKWLSREKNQNRGDRTARSRAVFPVSERSEKGRHIKSPKLDVIHLSSLRK